MLDASVAFPSALAADGFAELAGEELVAPPLMWSETRSALRLRAWQGVIEPAEAREAHERLERAPVSRRSPAALGSQAWEVCDELGWARTYDAEYVALARLLRCRLVTLDNRLRRGAHRLGLVVLPSEL